MTTSAHPVYLSLGNHLSEGRKTERGRRLLTLIPGLPQAEPDVHKKHHTYYCNLYFLRIYETIFDLVRKYEDGFELILPSASTDASAEKVSVLYPRIGVFTGDIPEMHSLTGVATSDSIRCVLKLKAMKTMGPEPESHGRRHEAGRLVAVRSHCHRCIRLFYNGLQFSHRVFVFFVVLLCVQWNRCTPRDPAVRQTLLEEFNLQQHGEKHPIPAKFSKAAKTSFRSNGYLPLLCNPLEHNRFSLLMGKDTIFDKMTCDELHMVRTSTCTYDLDVRF